MFLLQYQDVVQRQLGIWFKRFIRMLGSWINQQLPGAWVQPYSFPRGRSCSQRERMVVILSKIWRWIRAGSSNLTRRKGLYILWLWKYFPALWTQFYKWNPSRRLWPIPLREGHLECVPASISRRGKKEVGDMVQEMHKDVGVLNQLKAPKSLSAPLLMTQS